MPKTACGRSLVSSHNAGNSDLKGGVLYGGRSTLPSIKLGSFINDLEEQDEL